MVIKRIYNNNVAMVEDEGVERIAIGRGITFGRSRGDELDTSAVEKVFTLDDPDSLNRLERLIKGIPSEYLSVAEDIVAMLRAELGSDVDDNVLIALTDHISMAIERERAEVPCDNPLLMETRRFYKKEFALALRAQDIIEDRLGIRVSEGEVGFITLHIVNATMRQRADHLMLSISMINEILGIVAEAFDLVYDKGPSNTSASCATCSSSPSACSTRASCSRRTPSCSIWVKTSIPPRSSAPSALAGTWRAPTGARSRTPRRVTWCTTS